MWPGKPSASVTQTAQFAVRCHLQQLRSRMGHEARTTYPKQLAKDQNFAGGQGLCAQGQVEWGTSLESAPRRKHRWLLRNRGGPSCNLMKDHLPKGCMERIHRWWRFRLDQEPEPTPPARRRLSGPGSLPSEGDKGSSYDLALSSERPRPTFVDSQTSLVHPRGSGAQFVVQLLLLCFVASDPKALSDACKTDYGRMRLHQQQRFLLLPTRKPNDGVPCRRKLNSVLARFHINSS